VTLDVARCGVDQVQSPLAEYQQVNLVPLAVVVAELEIRTGSVWVALRKERPDQAQALRFVSELGARYLGPALRPTRHDAASSTRSRANSTDA
jgi:hypothetical protein